MIKIMTEHTNTISVEGSLSQSSFTAEEQVRMVYMQAPISNGVVVLISILYYFILKPHLNSNLLVFWMVALLLTASYRMYLWHSQKVRSEARSPDSWLRLYLIGCGLVGGSWSLIYLLLNVANDPFVWGALLMLAFGVISSAVPILSPYFPAFILYTYPQGLVLATMLYRFEDKSYQWLAFAVCVYMAMTTLFTHNINKRILKSISLQKQNYSLITDLNNEIIQREVLVERAVKLGREAEAANIAKSDFLANMSHELRTPLNHIIGFSELIVSKHFGDLNNTQEEYLKDVLVSSQHLLALVNDILDLSKVEAGKLELQPAQVDLRSLLEDSLFMVKEKVLKHRLTLSTQFNDLPEKFQADERKIRQVVYNLLSNAVKFTQDGGEVTLSACSVNGIADIPSGIIDPDNTLNTGSKKNGNWVKVSVQDTGVGIDKAALKRIFKPFEQIESSNSRQYQGTGLGLSLVKNIIELHGGSVWADSDGENSGTTVSFVIPSQVMKTVEAE